MSIPVRIQLAIIASVALPTTGGACSCYVQPLAERYQSASVVLVARIGELHDRYDTSGAIVRSWSFEAIEVLKGGISFDELIAGSCGGHVAEGGEYLIFTGSDGEVDSCRSGELSRNARYRAELEVLRERGGDGLQALREPWVFDRRDGMCSLALEIPAGGRVSFDYRFADAVTRSDHQYRYDPVKDRAVELKGLESHPATFAGFSRLRVWYPYSNYRAAGTGRLIIGGRDWATQHETMEGQYAPFEVVADSAFSDALSAVEVNDGAWLSAEYREFPYGHKDFPDWPEIKNGVPQYYRGNAVRLFRECLDQAGQ